MQTFTNQFQLNKCQYRLPKHISTFIRVSCLWMMKKVGQLIAKNYTQLDMEILDRLTTIIETEN